MDDRGDLFFFVTAVAGRSVSAELDTFELLFYRSVIGIFIVTFVTAMAGTLPQVNRHRIGTHLLRNITHFAGQSLWYFALTVIPLAQVFALEFTSPLWVVLLSPLPRWQLCVLPPPALSCHWISPACR